jgi:hypothetical protein
MKKLIKDNYFNILAVVIFISVFLYQFFYMVNLPTIIFLSQAEFNYSEVLLNVFIIIIGVSILYNIPLLITITFYQQIEFETLHIDLPLLKKYYNYVMVIITQNRQKNYSVYRC